MPHTLASTVNKAGTAPEEATKAMQSKASQIGTGA